MIKSQCVNTDRANAEGESGGTNQSQPDHTGLVERAEAKAKHFDGWDGYPEAAGIIRELIASHQTLSDRGKELEEEKAEILTRASVRNLLDLQKEVYALRSEVERLTREKAVCQHDRDGADEDRERLSASLQQMTKALERIERWFGEFPPSGSTWEDGRPMSYGAAFGSNGERDYMRAIARAALTALNTDKDGGVP